MCRVATARSPAVGARDQVPPAMKAALPSATISPERLADWPPSTLPFFRFGRSDILVLAPSPRGKPTQPVTGGLMEGLGRPSSQVLWPQLGSALGACDSGC